MTILRRLQNWVNSKGVVVTFDFMGDKDEKQVHGHTCLTYKPLKEHFVIDWTNKEIHVYGNEKLQRHICYRGEEIR